MSFQPPKPSLESAMPFTDDTIERRAELFWSAIDACANLEDLEQRFGSDLLWLESDSRTERYGFVSVSGESVHVCVQCHELFPSDADLSDGCEACGFGMPEFDELAEAA
jgi:hypothetical protein